MMNEKKKRKINALALLFYQMSGCHVDSGYDFSAAHHPAEAGCWNQAIVAWAMLKKDSGMLKHQI